MTSKKSQLRAHAKHIRSGLKEMGGLDAIEQATFHAKQLLKGIDSAVTVGLYHPIGDEMETRYLAQSLQTMGRQTALPCVKDKHAALIFRLWESGDPLVKGAYGTREPEPEAPEIVPGVVLCPLLAYDKNCYRLGYGGGFYDRTLMKYPVMKAFGLAYGGQIVDNLIVEDHDVPMHGIITESGLILPQK
ncbi:5-formyltetrahydrofolate cyclo-ligase [Temperatibacter marinus]|uniref:5-formyltetrahydrofolate cyclo-ligase n=1 Tax=Temperatibacter marinus TaxID=1456591 RepID=A0AA52EK58_9PROT|nr:5-formyltetrahydrofolate cyclo-ligase [Temperatibacter marinus]WND04017.1 5-formyltetrahydrofolate cyclo-ligase [Temperatibacter marinus]